MGKLLQHKVWLACLGVYALILGGSRIVRAGETDPIVVGVASVLVAAGLLIGWGLVVGVVALLGKLVRRPLTATQFLSILTVLLVLQGLATSVSDRNRAALSTADSLRSTVYEPSSAPVGVTFSHQPELESIHVSSPTGDLLPGERAEVVLSNGAFQRAEFSPLSPAVIASIDESVALADMQMYAEHQGLYAVEYGYEERPYAKFSRLRGFRELADPDGNAVPVIIEMHAYYGDGSAMFLYAGALSSDYPTPEIAQFWSSVSP